MSLLFGWIGSRGDPRAREIVGQMSRALRTSDQEASAAWIFEGGAIGVMASPGEKALCQGQPTVSTDGRYSLWVAGAYRWPRAFALIPTSMRCAKR
jgi:hypothetical protein